MSRLMFPEIRFLGGRAGVLSTGDFIFPEDGGSGGGASGTGGRDNLGGTGGTVGGGGGGRGGTRSEISGS